MRLLYVDEPLSVRVVEASVRRRAAVQMGAALAELRELRVLGCGPLLLHPELRKTLQAEAAPGRVL